MRGSGARHIPWPSRPAHWLATRSLRGQLITGVVALLALACAGVGLVTYLVLSHTLLNQLDDQLQAAGGRYASCMEEEHHEGPPLPKGVAVTNCNKTPGLSAGTFGARVKDGVVTDQGIIDGQSHLSAADKALLTRLPPDGRYYSEDLDSIHGDYRLTAIKGLDGDVLITGLPLSGMESTLHKVEIAELVAFSAALVLAGIIATGFVRLSLRPLRRVAATATRVTQLPLASGEVTLPERVPGADPRTEAGQLGAAFNRMLGHVESALAPPGGQRGPAAPLRRRRQPRAAHAAGRDPRLRRAGPPPSGRGAPDIAHALSRVESESARMSVLVDELLLLAQLDAGRPLARAPVDLTRLAIDATSDARAAAPDHRWLLELPEEAVLVRGDEYRLHQVLANLMIVPDNMAGTSWDAAYIVVDALRRLGAQATTIAALSDYPGINGIYDFPKYPERGLGQDNTVVTRWSPARGRALWASQPGGEPLPK